MGLIIYGKHPLVGDFLAHGLDTLIFRRFDSWLEQILPPLKEDLGAHWETTWAAASPLNFWIGPDVLGVPLLGVFMPSHDKVGRRFPFILGLSGVVTPPPLHKAHDPTPYIALADHIAGFTPPEQGMKGAASFAEGFVEPLHYGVPFEKGQDGTLWGHREDGDLGRLFSDAATADADKAQLGRSHWWHGPLNGKSAIWLGANGLPDLTGMRWLLSTHETTTEDAEDE